MDKFDIAILQKTNKKLLEGGIDEGCIGTIVEKNGNKCVLYFQNKNNLGDYAFGEVEEENLLFCRKYDEEQLDDFKQYLSEINSNKTAFKKSSFKFGDKVILLNDKPSYYNFGVKKGMKGVIVSDFAMKNQWSVLFEIFSPTSEDDDIFVDENDLEIQ